MKLVEKSDKKLIKICLSLAITIAIYVFLLQKIDLKGTIYLIESADYRIIALALCISVVGKILISSYRWKLILKYLGCFISGRESLLIKMGSDSIISILPMRTGEFSRALYLKRVKGFSYQWAVFSIVSEYLLNMFALLFFILVGMIIYLNQGQLLIRIKALSLGMLSFLVVKGAAENSLLAGFYNRFNISFKMYVDKFKILLKKREVILCTFLLGLAELTNVYLLSRAVGHPFPLGRVFIFIPLVIIISSLPITIAGLGLRETALIYFFSKYASSEVLVSLGILYFLVEHFFPMIIGSCLTGVFLKRVLWNKSAN